MTGAGNRRETATAATAVFECGGGGRIGSICCGYKHTVTRV